MEVRREEAQPCPPGNPAFQWLSGNIRRKLTLFVVVILIIVIGLFWFFTVYMLQPAYQNSIKRDISTQLGVVVEILDKAYAEGVTMLEPVVNNDGTPGMKVSDEVIDRLNAALRKGSLNLDDRCLEIADRSLKNVLLADNLEPSCLLHLSYESGIRPEGIQISSEKNGDFITLIRAQVFENGSHENAEVRGQYVLGRTAAGGTLSVVMSANMGRIPQAVSVLKQLLLPLSFFLGLFSMMAAWIFSGWFTKPLNKLSAATREMAKGNYSVRVADCGDDEIGDLARDFNAMAYEVGRSADLQRDLLANVSHDLRTPLTLIKGYAETVRDLTGDEPEKRTEQLNVIVDESDRLSALVGSVLELSRMSSGVEKAESIVFDLNDLCDELSYRYETVSAQSGYHFEFKGEEGCVIKSDPKLLERALHNLLGNALKHVGPDGYIGLVVEKTRHDTVRCEVRDHGPGIEPEDLPHIFDRYYRSRSDTGKPGTGLGLSITKVIFDGLELPYGVQSQPGEGACFWFEAPLVKV